MALLMNILVRKLFNNQPIFKFELKQVLFRDYMIVQDNKHFKIVVISYNNFHSINKDFSRNSKFDCSKINPNVMQSYLNCNSNLLLTSANLRSIYQQRNKSTKKPIKVCTIYDVSYANYFLSVGIS